MLTSRIPRCFDGLMRIVIGLLLLSTSLRGATAQDLQIEEEVVVRGRSQDLVGEAPAASAGEVGQAEIARVPFLRNGEVLERVPGMIVTQHSGTGKANQYFLRGFNLDHGTDFSTWIEGVPMNLPTNAHGQGYLDLNSVIPEIIDVLEFRKGPYYTDVGDFSSAGTSAIEYFRRIDRPFFKLGIGENDYYRLVPAGSVDLAGGDLLLAGEVEFYDGPWDQDENYKKLNGIGKWTWGDDARGAMLLVSGYSSRWDSTDQIPHRAVEEGLIGRLGNLDNHDGGNTSRYTGSAAVWNGRENPTRAQLYVVAYDLDLFSNFTYYLDDPVNGDQFEQREKRTALGFNASQEVNHSLASLRIKHTMGVQFRQDWIDPIALYHTMARDRIGTTRRDHADVSSLGVYWQADSRPLDWLRGYVGIRSDFQWYDVHALSLPENSGNNADGIAEPKVGLAFGPWAESEIYLNYGRGFHSNDARGTTIKVDPQTGDPANTVDPLVASEGAEIGARTGWLPGLQSTLAFWWLDLDSELLFVGDAGNTEATRPSRRYGVELTNYWQPLDWLTLDADATFTKAEFRDDEPEGNDIPGAIETTVASGAAVQFENGLFGSLRLRHFGKRPLTESGSIKSDPTTVVNMQAGWTWRGFPWGELTWTLDVLNLLDSHDDDITYYYTSRLPGEPLEGVEDKHYHPVEPLTVRGYVTWTF